MGALAVIDIQERDGHYRQRHEVQRWPVSIGRGLDNDIVLDDPHVAARHLDLREEDGQVRFTVGETRNGVRIDGEAHAAGAFRCLARSRRAASGAHDTEAADCAGSGAR